MLRNPSITYIDGVNNSLLLNHYNTLLANGNNNDVTRGAIFDAVTARSYDASASLHYNVANFVNAVSKVRDNHPQKGQ